MKNLIAVTCLGFVLSAFSAPEISYAEGHWDCNSKGIWCWHADDNADPAEDQKCGTPNAIFKMVAAKADAKAARLRGVTLLKAASAATIEAEVSRIKAAALNRRLADVIKQQIANKKNGVQERGFWTPDVYCYLGEWDMKLERCVSDYDHY